MFVYNHVLENGERAEFGGPSIYCNTIKEFVQLAKKEIANLITANLQVQKKRKRSDKKKHITAKKSTVLS